MSSSTSSSGTQSSSVSGCSDVEIFECLSEISRALRTTLSRVAEEAIAESSAPPRKRKRLQRDREQGQERLMRDYFVEEPVFPEDVFRRRFRMSKALFMRIVNDLQNATPFFTQRWDARGYKGFTPLQKCTSAIRQLAYGTAPDALDEYLHMSQRTSREVLQKFCKYVIKLYSKEYLRRPTARDIEKLYEHHEATHGFPGMLGSIDCTHWVWRNCPTAWRGQYMRGDHGHPTLMLEAVASQDLWIWHAFFGVAGSNNDINVLNQSTLLDDVYSGKSPVRPFEVNGVQYTYGYYLADGIYPEWATFVKAFQHPQDAKRLKFKRAQESARKDIERAFGVLKARWAILQNPARPWSTIKLCRIMYACIILHNMILQDEGHAICTFHEDDLPPPPDPNSSQIPILQAIHRSDTHINLRSDLVEHIDRVRQNVEDDP